MTGGNLPLNEAGTLSRAQAVETLLPRPVASQRSAVVQRQKLVTTNVTGTLRGPRAGLLDAR